MGKFSLGSLAVYGGILHEIDTSVIIFGEGFLAKLEMTKTGTH
jgi:hypothetical protein